MDWQCIINPSGCAVSWALGLAQDTIIGQWAESLWAAVGQLLIVIGTLWINIPTPSLTAGYSPVGWINNVLGYITAAVFIGSLMVSGSILAWRARKESLREIGEGIALFTLVTGAGTLVLEVLIKIGDELSNYFLEAASGNPEAFAKNLTGLIFNTPNAATNAAILIFVGILALLANIIQVVLMFARSGLLMLLAGFLPMMAALAVSPAGKTWLKKGVGWSLAFVMYKPVAALIYAVAIKMMSSMTTELNGVYHPLLKAAATGDQDGAMGIIMAGALMVVAVFALPALIAFLVPSTAALSGGGAGSGLASVSMAASGAVSLTGAARGMSGAKAGVAAASASPPTAAVVAASAGVSAVQSGVETVVSSSTGSNGTNGSNGVSGSAGTNGVNGSSGANGANGHSGSNGASGSAGANGSNGVNGSNGRNASTGASQVVSPAPVPPPVPRAVEVVGAKGFSA